MYTLYSILKNIICIWATWLHRYSNKKMGTDDFHLATKASMHCNVYLLYQATCLSLIFSIVFIVTKLSCTIQFTFAENAIFNTLPRGQINNLQKPYRKPLKRNIQFILFSFFPALLNSFIFNKVWIFWEGHKIWKNLPLKIWRYSVTSNFMWKIFSNFMVFSESPNFN